MLRFHNFLTREEEPFRPLKKGAVGLYTCGPTVYNHQHLGNYRTFIFEDVLRRTLQFSKFRVKHVMNITDVGHLTSDADTGEDKMEAGAKREGKTVWDVAKFFTKEFKSEIKKLNILPAHILKPATSEIPAQIKIIKQLFRKGYAYETATAVYFHIPKFKRYTEFSRQPLDKQLQGSREEVVIDPDKKHPADFVLWFKLAGKYKDHVMQWPSPWGRGFPGWHIECSAISTKYLGQPFDIHTGGIDHVTVHHTNEIAQSEGAYDKPLAKYWLEGEHMLIDGHKMSKSLGNVHLIGDLEKKGFNPLDFRYFVLGAHYRTHLNFTWEALSGARQARESLQRTLERISAGPFSGTLRDETAAVKVVRKAEKEFSESLARDVNTPKALAALNELMHDANGLLDRKLLTKRTAKIIRAAVLSFDKILGLKLETKSPAKIPGEIALLVKEREEARRKKNWRESDRIREEIKKIGYVIEDTPSGPHVRRG